MNKTRRTIVLALVVTLLATGAALPQDGIIELDFKPLSPSGSDESRTLKSLIKVQGTGGLDQDALYLITQAGNRNSLFDAENQRAIDQPWRRDTWRYCSEFVTKTRAGVFMGRNWDNQNVGSIIVSLCHPPDSYASISFARAIDMGYPLNLDLEAIKSTELAHNLLLAPFYATDGINEHGLTVAIGGVRESKHDPGNGKPRVLVTYLIRKILDQTKTIQEAVALAEQFIPFDLDSVSLNSHLIIADSTGRSVILEYDHDQWRTIYANKSYQVLTNKPIYGTPEEDLQAACWRYERASETLDSIGPSMDWQGGLTLLRYVAQRGTTWSVVYSPTLKDLHFSIYQAWDVIYRLRM